MRNQHSPSLPHSHRPHPHFAFFSYIYHRTGGVSEAELETNNTKKSTNIKIAENTFTEQQREMVASFSGSLREPEAGEKVVYVDGDFDLFHIGHIEILKAGQAGVGRICCSWYPRWRDRECSQGIQFPDHEPLRACTRCSVVLYHRTL